MHKTIVVSGNLSEVLAKLKRMKMVIENRLAVGYPPMQHDEVWQYHTIQDQNVCGDCSPLNGNLYRGDCIVHDFPFHVSVGFERVLVHNSTNFHSANRCRCEAVWINAHDILVLRLAYELENA
jgi:hypothetical protein